jgi:hypothetical protein
MMKKKRIILRCLVMASICVVALWAIFTVKPMWWGDLMGRLFSSVVASKKGKAEAQYPSKPVFNVVPPKRINPSPPATPSSRQQAMMAEQMERSQTQAPGIPSSASSSTPPSTYPGTRPEVTVQSPPAITSSSPLQKGDSESDEYLEIASLYAQKGKYQKAEELFQKVAKENPSSAKAHNNLGFVYLRQQKYGGAEREFKEAMRLDPAFALPYYNLACLYTRKGMDVEALIYLKRAMNRDARVKGWATSDEDLTRLWSDVVFQELVGSASKKKAASQNKEDAPRQEDVQKMEGPQKQEGAQQQEIQQQDDALKHGVNQNQEPQAKEGAQKPEMTLQEDVQKKEVMPAPVHEGPPKQENTQKLEGTQGNNQGGTQNQEATGGQGSVKEGGAKEEGTQGGTTQ